MVQRSYSRGREALRVHVQNTNRPAEKSSCSQRRLRSHVRTETTSGSRRRQCARYRGCGTRRRRVWLRLARRQPHCRRRPRRRRHRRAARRPARQRQCTARRSTCAPSSWLSCERRGEARTSDQSRRDESEARVASRRVSKGHCALELHCRFAQRVLCERRDATRQDATELSREKRVEWRTFCDSGTTSRGRHTEKQRPVLYVVSATHTRRQKHVSREHCNRSEPIEMQCFTEHHM